MISVSPNVHCIEFNVELFVYSVIRHIRRRAQRRAVQRGVSENAHQLAVQSLERLNVALRDGIVASLQKQQIDFPAPSLPPPPPPFENFPNSLIFSTRSSFHTRSPFRETR